MKLHNCEQKNASSPDKSRIKSKRGDKMRKRKHNSAITPYAAGLILGYAAAILVSAGAALLLSFTDTASKTAGAAAVLALSIGSFVCGRTAGAMRRRNGLKTGALCGLLFSVLPIILSLIFRLFGTVMLIIKPILCIAFGAVGGVAGVNKE